MRKISKFRAWIIRKLGGIPTSNLIKPVVAEQKINTKTLTYTISLTPEQEYWYGLTSKEKLEQEVKRLFVDKLKEQISDYITVYFDRNENGNLDCRVYITLTKPTECNLS